ncbi:MAG: DUF3373 domain-containing protein, partial [Flexistipes sinusarabici]
MYKAFGEATDVRFITVISIACHLDGNSASVPTDDSVHVERAYFVYRNRLYPVGRHFSFGRRSSNMVCQWECTKMRFRAVHLWHTLFSGISTVVHLDLIMKNILIHGILSPMLKFCYGQGFDGQWGTADPFNAQ